MELNKQKYNPNIHHRRSIRLKGYDYSQEGLYFITICCQNHECLFGEIVNGEMVLNDAGKMIEKWCRELENKFPDIKIGVFTIMPNHFHAIVENVGAHLCVRPDNNDMRPDNNDVRPDDILGEHAGSPLHRVVQWFKTMTTNEYIRGVKSLNWQSFDKRLWQRNYWEHIIRNDRSYYSIYKYIINNPANWDKDMLNTPSVPVGADLRVCPDNNDVRPDTMDAGTQNTKGAHAGAPLPTNQSSKHYRQ